jgi:methyl-accepting chemotaxis protein
MPNLQIRSLKAKMLLLLLPPVIIAVAALTLFAVNRATSQERESRLDAMTRLAESSANDIDAQARRDQAVGRSLAVMVEAYRGQDRGEVNAILKQFLDRNPQVAATFVGFDPNAFDGADAAHRGEPGSDDAGRFGPYWNTLGGAPKLDVLIDQEKSEYWTVPERTQKPAVIEPYLYEGAVMTSYNSPVLRDGKFVGIGGVDVLLGKVDEEVKRVHFLESGYGFLVSRTGIFVSAPQKDLLGKATLTELADKKGNADLRRVAGAIAQGRGGQVETTDPFTGKDVVLSWAPVKTGSWGFVAVAPVDEVLAEANRMRTTLLLIGLVALVLVSGAILFVASRLTKPIVDVTEAAERLSDGDVDVEVAVRGHDEVARLGTAFTKTVDYLGEMAGHANRIAAGDLTREVEPRSGKDLLGVAFRDMRRKLSTLVGAVSDSSQVLSAASQEMASTSEEAGRAVGEIASAVSDVAQGAERQVRSIEAARQATEEVGTATASSAASARETASAALEARRIAAEGQQAVAEATEAMRQVRDSSTQVTAAMHQLASKSEQIGGIVETITGIAGQTNLLALNAAIEAARAGEQGRGFAVVAEEVRKLAEESQEAAASIAALVEEIQGETAQAVAVVEDGAARSEQGAATVDQARSAFEAIGDSVDGMSGRVEAIAAAVQQIAASAERVQADMIEVAAVAEESSASSEEVSASTEQTSASAQEIASSAQQLAGTATELQQLVGQFTVAAS